MDFGVAFCTSMTNVGAISRPTTMIPYVVPVLQSAGKTSGGATTGGGAVWGRG